jgi:PncC family amidohydrolase
MSIIANKIANYLSSNKLTISSAESCTGGLLSSTLTDIPGSSKFFISGITAYHNKEKIRLLRIPPKLIKKYGAVSKEVATLMAKNCARLAKTDLAVSITGIAGPTGGSKEKPVGTVFIAVKFNYGLLCKRFFFKGNRVSIKKQTVAKALALINSCL